MMNSDVLPDTTTCLGEEAGGFSGGSSGEDSGAAAGNSALSKIDPR